MVKFHYDEHDNDVPVEEEDLLIIAEEMEASVTLSKLVENVTTLNVTVHAVIDTLTELDKRLKVVEATQRYR